MRKKWIIRLGVITILLCLGLFLFFQKPSEMNPSTENNDSQEALLEADPEDLEDEVGPIDDPELKRFVNQFLEKFIQYDPEHPQAHIEKIKPQLTDEVYQEQKNLYKNPIATIKDRQFVSMTFYDAENIGNGNIQVKALIQADIFPFNQEKWTAEIGFELTLFAEGDSWKVRGLTSAEYNE